MFEGEAGLMEDCWQIQLDDRKTLIPCTCNLERALKINDPANLPAVFHEARLTLRHENKRRFSGEHQD
jgi:hypothetical protein